MPEIAELSIGSPAIDFKLPASNGTEISLMDYQNKKNVYLFFVREFI
jgi:peroxiredoxin